MAMRDDLMTEIKAAMKARDADRLSTLRLINAAIKDREIAERSEAAAEGREGVTDDEILGLLGRMVKQRQESARAYMAGSRPDLAAKEQAEIAVIGEFLPRQLSDVEVEAAIVAAIAETGAVGLRDMGRVMAALKAAYTGQMDFGAAGPLVKARLG